MPTIAADVRPDPTAVPVLQSYAFFSLVPLLMSAPDLLMLSATTADVIMPANAMAATVVEIPIADRLTVGISIFVFISQSIF